MKKKQPNTIEPREFKVEFSQTRNDMFWKLCFFNEGEEFEWFSTTWVGYDDANWWTNVAPKLTRKVITGDKGTKLTVEIDFRKCIAKEILEEK